MALVSSLAGTIADVMDNPGQRSYGLRSGLDNLPPATKTTPGTYELASGAACT